MHELLRAPRAQGRLFADVAFDGLRTPKDVGSTMTRWLDGVQADGRNHMQLAADLDVDARCTRFLRSWLCSGWYMGTAPEEIVSRGVDE